MHDLHVIGYVIIMSNTCTRRTIEPIRWQPLLSTSINQGALIFKGGYDAHTWTHKMDPKQVFSPTKKHTLSKYFVYKQVMHPAVKYTLFILISAVSITMYTLNMYHNFKGWKTYPFFKILLFLTPFSMYGRISTVGKKQPFYLFSCMSIISTFDYKCPLEYLPSLLSYSIET